MFWTEIFKIHPVTLTTAELNCQTCQTDSANCQEQSKSSRPSKHLCNRKGNYSYHHTSQQLVSSEYELETGLTGLKSTLPQSFHPLAQSFHLD